MDEIRKQHLETLKKICKDTIWSEKDDQPLFPARVDGQIGYDTWRKWSRLGSEVQSERFGNDLGRFIAEEAKAGFDAMQNAVPPDVQRRKDALRRK